MDKLTIIMLSFLTVAAIGGLILVVLQKKGIVKPVLTQTATGFNFTSGGTITLSAVAVAAYIMYSHSVLSAVLYMGVFLGAYILIQYIFRKK